MKRTVDAFDYAPQIMKAMPKGILLTTADGEKVNTMTIGWGALCIEWGIPLFIAYVRESRYTKQMLERNGQFTINVPLESVDRKIISYCGSQSGAQTDKIRDLGLQLVPSDVVAVPGIREFPLTLECEIIYQQKQDLSMIPQSILDRFYPQDAAGEMDGHIAYYGRICNAYIIDP